MNTPELKQIPVEKLIIRHEENARIELTDMEELQASIKEHGIICPITVAKEGDGYRVVAGFRRATAVTNLKLKTIPAMVRDEKKDAEMIIQLSENLERSNWSTYETASQLKKIMETQNINRDQLAKKLNRSNAFVSNHLFVFDMPEEIQEAAKSDKIGVTHLRAIHPFLKKLDDKGFLKVARQAQGLSPDKLDVLKKKLNEKLAASDTKGTEEVVEETIAAAAAPEEPVTAASEDKADAPALRAHADVLDAIDELNSVAEGVESDTGKAKMVGRIEALMWVLGDDSIELFE